MRGLWLMAAWLRACHCPACLRTTSNVARRSSECSIASYPRRRKPLASHVFTARYSTAIPGLSTIDTGWNDTHRLAEFDGKIPETNRSLMAALESGHARDLAQALASLRPDTTFYDGPLDKLSTLTYICNIQPEFLMEYDSEYRERLAARNRDRKDINASWWIARDTVGTSTLVQCEKALIEEESNPNVRYREPKTEKQMLKHADMINNLVDSLLTEAYWVTEAEAPGSHPSLSSPDSVMTMIRLLRSEGYPRYNHPDLDPAATVEARARLNEANLKISADWVSPHRERCVAKICYNLLVCTVPPGIQNYNTLILAFSQLGEHDLAEVVVDSFLFGSRMRPTAATILCMLQHYRLSNDMLGFWRILRRIFGHDPRGVGLRRRTVEDREQDHRFKRWVEGNDVSAVDDYFIKRVPLSQNLIETMMEGLIDFGMLREAAKLLAICFEERWDIDSDLLTRLFQQCLDALDIGAARVIIQSLLDNHDQAMNLLFGPKSLSGAAIVQLRYILSICYATSLPGRSISRPDVDPQVLATRSFNNTRLKHLVTAIWMRSIWPHNGFLAKRLRISMTGLTKNASAGQFKDGLYVGMAIADDLARIQRKNQQVVWKCEHVRYVARVAWLESQYLKTMENIKALENLLLGTLIRTVPRPLRQYHLLNPEVPIEQRIARIMIYSTPGTDQYRRAMCFFRKQEIDDRVNAMLMDALPPSHVEPLQLLMLQRADSMERIRILYSHFNKYLKALRKMRSRKTQTAGWAGAFSGLLTKLPKPNLTFWRRAPDTDAVSSRQ
ncbi:Pentatricopeptide repeat domain-containing protein [Madurella fahalii]|uniref:Pentatricopeptide repeat domain-containing protein n=1 Tax=Madurella fahalii TaxID=1157608 RepID=A0ABQ0G5X8_9PEZI